jgi:hypothetical protein
VQTKENDGGGGLSLLLPQCLSQVSWPVVELLELESQFTGSFLRDQIEMGCGRVTRHKGKNMVPISR